MATQVEETRVGVPRLARFVLRPFPVLVVLGLCWALATPVFGPPDEPSQVVKAAAVAHGQLVGTPTEGPYTAVYVPEGLIGTDYTCFAYQISAAASCAPPLHGGRSLVVATTYSGRYPPLYYLLVGWPSLFLTGSRAIYGMRVLTAVLVALFLASAFRSASASRNRRLLLPAYGVVVTPYVLYLAGAVNPSGVELASAVCAWTSGLVLTERDGGERSPAVTNRLLVRLGIALAVLVQLRGLGLLMAGFVIVTLGALGGRTLFAHLKSAVGRVMAVVAGVSGVVAALWLLVVGGLGLLGGQFLPPDSSNWELLGQSLIRYGRDLVQMVGMFGWWDGTYLPRGVYLVWFGLALGAVVLAVVTTNGYRRAVVLSAAFVSAAVPVLLVAHQARFSGIVGQGRYWYPLTVGAVLLAAHQARPPAEERLRWLVHLSALTVLVLQVVAFRFALDRYRFGIGGAPGATPWSPPGGARALTIPYVVAVVVLCTLWWKLAAPSPGVRTGRTRRTGFIVVAALFGAIAAVFTGVPALAVASATYRWVGALDGSARWSQAASWSPPTVRAATSGAALVFPAGTGCPAQRCTAVDDLSSASALGIGVETLQGRTSEISGSHAGPVTLGLGGLTVEGSGRARIGVQLTPVGDQQWYLQAPSTELAGGVYGINSVSLNVGRDATVAVTANMDVGDMVLDGTGTPDVTRVTLNGAELNGGGENPVAVVRTTLAGQGHVGPLTTSGARLEVGTGADAGAGGPGVLASTGDIAFDPATTLVFRSIGGPGPPGRTFAQLTSPGNVSLGSAVLELESSCVSAVGDSFPILQAGALAGAFSRPDGSPIANGDVVTARRSGPGTCDPRYRILYGSQAVTAVRV